MALASERRQCLRRRLLVAQPGRLGLDRKYKAPGAGPPAGPPRDRARPQSRGRAGHRHLLSLCL